MHVLLEPQQRRLTWSPFFRCLGAVGEAEQIHFSTLRFLPTPTPVPCCIFPTFGGRRRNQEKKPRYISTIHSSIHSYTQSSTCTCTLPLSPMQWSLALPLRGPTPLNDFESVRVEWLSTRNGGPVEKETEKQKNRETEENRQTEQQRNITTEK